MNQLEGKVALVTGGAQGLGEATARLFAKEGATVILADLNEARCEEIATEIRDSGGQAVARRLDVTSESDWIELIAFAEATFGRLNVLVNNAGVSTAVSIEDMTFEKWRFIQSINLDGVFLGCRSAIRLMKQTGGSIVNLSSIWGLVGAAGMGAYCASKAGVVVLTKAIAIECGKAGYGIRANTIHPGFMETPMLWNFLDNSGDPEGNRKVSVDLHPIGHLGQPEDIAQGALYLASDASKFVTGAELKIDGGYTAW